jgi:hypothetical protein
MAASFPFFFNGIWIRNIRTVPPGKRICDGCELSSEGKARVGRSRVRLWAIVRVWGGGYVVGQLWHYCNVWQTCYLFRTHF